MADESKVHVPKPDPMASRAPAQALRPVVESPSSGIEVGLPSYYENRSGQILDASLYITQDPEKEYRFCTRNERFGAQIRRNKGFVSTKASDGKEVIVAGMQLCERPIALKHRHDEYIKSETLRQSRKHSAESARESAASQSGISASLISASERSNSENVG